MTTPTTPEAQLSDALRVFIDAYDRWRYQPVRDPDLEDDVDQARRSAERVLDRVGVPS